MIPAEPHPQEATRLSTLLDHELLDTGFEEVFEELTELASTICGTPIALVSLIDSDRQWFKSRHGLDASETPRDYAFCAHAILQDDVFIVEDALKDERFYDNPIVAGEPRVIFYAGAVIRARNDMPLGTLCIIDHKPREFTQEQSRVLKVLARQVESQIELRQRNIHLARMNATKKDTMAIVAHDLKGAFSSVFGFSRLLAKKMQDKKLESEMQAMGLRLTSCASEVVKLLDELLRWSESEMDSVKAEMSDYDPAISVKSCLDLFAETAQMKDISFKSTLPEGLTVFTNQVITTTILRNFISNALKYSYKGGTIEIGADRAPHETVLYVRDFGKGMPVEVREVLFKAPQSSEPGTDNETGLGIGLSLCRSMALSQQSRVWVDSGVTDGSKMCLSIPVVAQP